MAKSEIIAISFWAFVLSFFVFFLVGLPGIRIEADTDTASTAATIGNATPTVSYSGLQTSVTLTENGSSSTATTTITVSDDNGCEDIATTTLAGELFDDNAVNQGCTANGQNCYTVDTSACTYQDDCTAGGGDTQLTYSCSVNLWHYANASAAWKWNVSVDDGTATGTATSSAVTVGSLVALDVAEASINYGTVALNATSAEQSITISNTGNDTDLDTGIKANSTLSCTVGSMATSTQEYSTSTGFSFGSGTSLSSTVVTFQTSLAQGSDSTHTPSDSVYWLLQTPSSGVSGSCSGENYFEAQ